MVRVERGLAIILARLWSMKDMKLKVNLEGNFN